MSGVRRKQSCTVSNTQQAGLHTEIVHNTHNASLKTMEQSQTHHCEPISLELMDLSVSVCVCALCLCVQIRGVL